MNHRKNRRRFGAEFKAKVALEALSERQTLSELAEKYGIRKTRTQNNARIHLIVTGILSNDWG